MLWFFWFALHMIGYLALLAIMAIVVPRSRLRSNRKAHNRCLENIFRLELAMGIGVDYSRDWLDAKSLKTRDSHLTMIGKYFCYGCETWHEARGGGFHKLCRSCREKAKVAA